jgi:polysaccharide biosynthesis/export protein
MQLARLGAAVTCLATTALLGTLVLAQPSRAQTVETQEQTNERIRSLAAASHIPPPHDYVIGSGDVVSIQVFDVPELTRDVRVSQTGSISIPLVPVRLHLAGLTETQAERKIEEVLQANGLISHPEVSLSVKEKRSKPITIVGAVGRPMVYQADRQMTLIEVLAEVGGVAADAGDHVIITRIATDASTDASEPPPITPEDAAPIRGQEAPAPASNSPSPALASEPAPTAASSSSPVADSSQPSPDGTTSGKPVANAANPAQISPPPVSNTITVNLTQILETGDLSNNIVLQPGDVVTVPHAGIVYVLGAVSRPGGFVVSNDRAQLTTLKVLSLAGGLNRTAKGDHAVIVRKDIDGQQHEVPVDLRKVMKFQTEDLQLRPSDILYVPNSGTKTALTRAGELALAVGTGVLIYRLVP